jgi:hypothetical protein
MYRQMSRGCEREGGAEKTRPRSRSTGFGRDREQSPAPSRGSSYFKSVIFLLSWKSGASIVQK